MKRLLALATLSMFLVGMALAAKAEGHRAHDRRMPLSVYKAVRLYWKTRARRIEAFNVIDCETGGGFNTTARNGQYLGLFQMGARERARYGHGSTARAQARAAHRYFVASGRDWSPWACQP